MGFLIYASVFINPVLAIVFCINLVEILKKVSGNQKEDTAKNTFWMTLAFVYIVGTITISSFIS
ncbi:hypothetical protein [Bacillus suaedae]|uniref:PCZ2.2 n=1 Tax=Halalkalibacter suaedae TaxID=2822140 RepID=A0A940WVN4_9BACI|nr:hypothetical protein [Bacillus suaedae]MBP3953116.1 hypothetical protein [Bacillus suaedae]